MNCTKCGQENSDQAQFCQGCGAALQTLMRQPGTIRIAVDKRILGGIGLIAGVLAMVGIFVSWLKVSAWGMSVGVSAWDSVTNATVMEGEVGQEAWACIALAGAVLTMVGALSTLVSPRSRVLWGILAIGGLLAIIGAAWGFSDIPTGGIFGVSVGYGPGVYLTLIGGILGLVGVVGLWKS